MPGKLTEWQNRTCRVFILAENAGGDWQNDREGIDWRPVFPIHRFPIRPHRKNRACASQVAEFCRKVKSMKSDLDKQLDVSIHNQAKITLITQITQIK